MDYILMGIAAAVIIAALMYFRKLYKAPRRIQQKSAAHGFVNCPVCGHPLMPGDNLVSKVYRPMNVNDQLCTIYGCPHCYPAVEPGLKRSCPVCKKEVSADGYLISRLFNVTKDGKKHVIINGCGSCKKGSGNSFSKQ